MVYFSLQKMALTEQKKRFADKYFETLKGAKSAIYAGYSEATAKQIAYNLLQEPEVEEYLTQQKEEYAEKAGVSKQWVIERFKFVSDACVQAIPVMEFDPVNKCMVQKFDDDGMAIYTFDSSGVVASTREIGKIIGAYDVDNSQKKPANFVLLQNDPLADGE